MAKVGVMLGAQPSKGELAAIAAAREQMPPLCRPTTFDGARLADEGCWRVLKAPGLPLFRPQPGSHTQRLLTTFDQYPPIVFGEAFNANEKTVGEAAAALCLLLVGIEALHLHPAEELPRATRSFKSDIACLSRTMEQLIEQRNAASSEADAACIEQQCIQLRRKQLALTWARSIRLDPMGSQLERFIKHHAVSVYKDIFRRRAAHSMVGASKSEAGGPFVRFVLAFAREVGMRSIAAATIAAALDPKKNARRKRQPSPGDGDWINKYLPPRRD